MVVRSILTLPHGYCHRGEGKESWKYETNDYSGLYVMIYQDLKSSYPKLNSDDISPTQVFQTMEGDRRWGAPFAYTQCCASRRPLKMNRLNHLISGNEGACLGGNVDSHARATSSKSSS